MNTVLVSVRTRCLEIHPNVVQYSLKLSLDVELLSTFDLLCWLRYHFCFCLMFMQKLR